MSDHTEGQGEAILLISALSCSGLPYQQQKQFEIQCRPALGHRGRARPAAQSDIAFVFEAGSTVSKLHGHESIDMAKQRVAGYKSNEMLPDAATDEENSLPGSSDSCVGRSS
jgi:hypothetical protein